MIITQNGQSENHSCSKCTKYDTLWFLILLVAYDSCRLLNHGSNKYVVLIGVKQTIEWELAKKILYISLALKKRDTDMKN